MKSGRDKSQCRRFLLKEGMMYSFTGSSVNLGHEVNTIKIIVVSLGDFDLVS